MLIYIIKNDVNDKVYIGQTTRSLKDRVRNYKNDVKWFPNKRPIISAMAKYGFDKFHFEILQDNIESKEELDRLEIEYIKKYNSLVTQNGYNVENGGHGVGKHSEKTKQKISEAQIGEKNHMYGKKGELNVTSKRVIELTTGRIYESANLAAESLKLNVSHVCAVARGTRGSTGGYVFRYIDENNKIFLPENRVKTKFKNVQKNILPEYKQYI